jgi:Zn-finger nucleic acid-binding protein
MSVEDRQDFFHCQYCGGYEFPNPNQDGVALLEEISSYICPLCQQPLVSAVVKKIHIWSCPNCRGNLIEQPKMLAILSHSQVSTPIYAGSHSLPDKTEFSRTISCPSCQKVMTVYPYGGPGNIIIQGCEPCQLIWMDFGELSKVVYSEWEMYNRSSDELGAKKKWIPF